MSEIDSARSLYRNQLRGLPGFINLECKQDSRGNWVYLLRTSKGDFSQVCEPEENPVPTFRAEYNARAERLRSIHDHTNGR